MVENPNKTKSTLSETPDPKSQILAAVERATVFVPIPKRAGSPRGSAEDVYELLDGVVEGLVQAAQLGKEPGDVAG